MQKYGFRRRPPVLERASAGRPRPGSPWPVAAAFLVQALGVRLVSPTVAIGAVACPTAPPGRSRTDVPALDADPVRCTTGDERAMVPRSTPAAGPVTLSAGVVEVLGYAFPPDWASYVHWTAGWTGGSQAR